MPTPQPSKPRLFVAQTDKYNHNLSNGYQQYNADDLSEGLLVINNTTNLSERLLVINNTSAKMTGVVNDLCG